MSETESSQSMDSEDDASTASTPGSESPVSTDNESETEEDSWMPLVHEAMQKHKTTFEEIKVNLIQSGLDTSIFFLRLKKIWKVSMRSSLEDKTAKERSCA